jgi:MYXO-CTERM domain-containing protein
MTLDPSFDFNPDLDDVSNVHTADRIIECHRSVTQNEAPWRAELPSGLVVRGEGGSWPFVPGPDVEMPATISVQTVETSGPGTIVRDNIEDIRRVLDQHNAAIPTVGGCGCRTARTASPGGSILLLLVGMIGLGIRRRR